MKSGKNSSLAYGWQRGLFAVVMLAFAAAFTAIVAFAIVSLIFNVEWYTFKFAAKDPHFNGAILTALWTSLVSTVIAFIFAIPVGYSLSRFQFPGKFLTDVLVDLSLVFPPFITVLAVHILFLMYFLGEGFKGSGWLSNVMHPAMLLPCQFVAASSLLIRSTKLAFDKVGNRHENIALTLGCSRWGSFFRVSLPMAWPGIISGAILTWLRAFGLFAAFLMFSDSFSAMADKFRAEFIEGRPFSEPEIFLSLALIIVSVAFVVLIAVKTAEMVCKKVRTAS